MRLKVTPEMQALADEVLGHALTAQATFEELEKVLGRPVTQFEMIYQSIMLGYLFAAGLDALPEAPFLDDDA